MDYEEFIRFVEEHRGDDPAKLRLKFHGDPRQWLPLAINNVAALKNRKKFLLRDGADLTPAIVPLEVSAQQSTSANIALLHANLAKDAMRVLDMTFGLGMDARMLAMNPQRRILGFDLQPPLADAARYNFRNFPNVEVRCGDSVSFLEEYDGEPFDLVFIDPARRGAADRRLFNLHDCQPDLIKLMPLLQRKTRRLMGKLSPMLDVTQTIRDLPGTAQLHIVEEGGECKELLAIVDFTTTTDEPSIVIDRLTPDGWQHFSFTQAQERAIDLNATLLGRLPQVGEILLEPSAATMKAAPFGLLSVTFGIRQLAANTHLYIAQEPQPSFPGTGYRLEAVYPLTSSNIKKLSKEVDKADIVVKNLKGFTSDSLAKKMRIKPGGSMRIVGTTVSTPAGSAPTLLLASKEVRG